MAKKVISVVAAFGCTIVMCAILGINIQSSIAVIVMAVAYTVIAYKVADDITDGTAITGLMWAVYGCAFVATTLFGIGMTSLSVPVLIAMGVVIVAGIVCYVLQNKNKSRGA